MDTTTTAAFTPRSAPAFRWSESELRQTGYRVVDLLAGYLTALQEKPVFSPMSGDEAARCQAAPLPIDGTAIEALLDDFQRNIAPHPFGNGHARFFGWVNSPPAPVAVLAELLAAGMNPSVAGGNHAAVYVERAVVNWFKSLLGFPDTSMGLLTSGGSGAALTALAVARHVACAKAGRSVREDGLQGARMKLVVYRSAETHSCHQKAVEVLGIGSGNLRTVPCDGALRMSPRHLDAFIREDLTDGRIPVAVVANAGTVNTGAIDPLDDIANVCRAYGVWLHVDGAYGAPAILAERYKAPLSQVSRADSVALDPHKWLYVPVEAGMVLVRNAQAMRDTFSLVPPYLRTDGNEEGVQGPPWFSEFGVQQTRGFRALKIWMAMRYFGVNGYRSLIEHDIEMADYLARRVRAAPGFQVREPTSLSIVCFRYAPRTPGCDDAQLTALNKRILSHVQLGGAAFLSGTVIDNRFWLRACVVNPLTTRADIDLLVGAVLAATECAGEAPQ